MHQRFLAVSQMPVAGGLDVWCPHDLEKYSRATLTCCSFIPSRSSGMVRSDISGVRNWTVPQGGEAILALGDIA